MPRQLELLPKPKRRRRVLMHVCDAGDRVIKFRCWTCGYETDWLAWDNKVTEPKKGKPCPRCNLSAAKPAR